MVTELMDDEDDEDDNDDGSDTNDDDSGHSSMNKSKACLTLDKM